MRNTYALVLLVFTAVAWAHFVSAAELHIAPRGRDTNPGTEDRPFATLAVARDAVVKLKHQQPNEPITVYLDGGVYRLDETVVFAIDDSGSPQQPITYTAKLGETPVLSGAWPVTGWQKLDQPPENVPEVARGNLWVADLSWLKQLKAKQPASSTVADQQPRPWWPLTLYANGEPLKRARGPGFSLQRKVDRASSELQTFDFPDQRVRNWPRLKDAELLVIPMRFWVSNILPLESVEASAGVARTSYPATYPLGRNSMNDRDTAWIENVVELLDEPGEWAVDSEEARLYLWPPEDGPPENIEAPVLTELVRIEGDIDYEGSTDRPVRNLAFRGITFAHGDRFVWHGQTGWGLQHDWERFDSPSAMLRFRGAEDCTVEDCHFRDAASSGIRFDLHAMKNRIVGNHVERLGGVGILLAGYGPGTKNVNRKNTVTNNYVHHTGQLYWGSPAVFAWQSGENLIAHNHIHHTPYTGICATGRIGWVRTGESECAKTVRWDEVDAQLGRQRARPTWEIREPFLHSRRNLILRNDIHNVMEVTGDGNCIYVSGAGGGNVVRENYCHDCTGRYMNAVIRCDDDQHQTLIERNIMHRTRGHGEGIISKGDNDIVGNIMADLRPDERHRGYLVFPYGSVEGSVVEHNVFYSCQRGQIIVHEGRSRRGGRPPRLRDTEADYNVYYCTEDTDWGCEHLERERAFGIEQHSIVADPQFVDPAAGDFTLKPHSPALKLGIEPPITIEKVGLQPPYRDRWFKRRISTTIRPRGGILREPVDVEIQCDRPSATIRYTRDGSEPNTQSPVYEPPLVIREAGIVRAKAFAPDAVDLTGTMVVFDPPPQPVDEDFETGKPGDRPSAGEIGEKDPVLTARLSDEHAASGKMSLKFTDGPEEPRYNPLVYYRVRFDTGRLVGRFSIFADQRTSFHYQWRDYSRGGYRRGPAIQINSGGEVFAGERELPRIPLGQWVTFEIVAPLGKQADGKFDIRLWTGDTEQPQEFTGLGYGDPLNEIDWLGLVANGHEDATFYVDDVSLREMTDSGPE